MSKKEKAYHRVANALKELHELSEIANQPDQWLAINQAEIAVNDILITFEQEIEDENISDN